MIDRNVIALRLEEATFQIMYTEVEFGSLLRYQEGDPCSDKFINTIVVGMLLYLEGHYRPDIVSAVHQHAHYTFCPKATHENTINRIGRYLKWTRQEGMILFLG